MKIIQNIIQNTKDILKIRDIKYLSLFLVCTIVAIFVSFILLLLNLTSVLNFNDSTDKTFGLTTLYLPLYYSIIFGFLLIIIINLLINKKDDFNLIGTLRSTLKSNSIYLFTDLIPIILWVISIISLIVLNYNYTIKINSNSLTDTFYIFNILYLGIVFFQLLTYIYYVRLDADKINNFTRVITNYILVAFNIIFTFIIWDQPLYFSTDG